MTTIDEVRSIVGEVLQLGARTERMDEATVLLGAVPEFDSMAVVSVITALEEHFGLVIEDDDINAEVFETLGNLVDFVNRKL